MHGSDRFSFSFIGSAQQLKNVNAHLIFSCRFVYTLVALILCWNALRSSWDQTHTIIELGEKQQQQPTANTEDTDNADLHHVHNAGKEQLTCIILIHPHLPVGPFYFGLLGVSRWHSFLSSPFRCYQSTMAVIGFVQQVRWKWEVCSVCLHHVSNNQVCVKLSSPFGFQFTCNPITLFLVCCTLDPTASLKFQLGLTCQVVVASAHALRSRAVG